MNTTVKPKRATKAERLPVLLELIKSKPEVGITQQHAQQLYSHRNLGEFSLSACDSDLNDLAYADDAQVIGMAVNGGKMKYYLRKQAIAGQSVAVPS